MSRWLGHGLECGSSSYRLLMFPTLAVRKAARFLFCTLRCRRQSKGGSCCYRTPRAAAGARLSRRVAVCALGPGPRCCACHCISFPRLSFRALTALGLPMMSRNSARAHWEQFVEFKGLTRRVSAERSEESRSGLCFRPGPYWSESVGYVARSQAQFAFLRVSATGTN